MIQTKLVLFPVKTLDDDSDKHIDEEEGEENDDHNVKDSEEVANFRLWLHVDTHGVH